MSHISKAEAENILAPIIPSLRACILEAWNQALTVPFSN
jgi:hypothetical protein